MPQAKLFFWGFFSGVRIRVSSNHREEREKVRDPRLEQLVQWLQSLFGAQDFTITVASADASFRRYFRVHRGGKTWIAMDAPPDKEDMKPYIRVAAMLADVGVNAPRILHSSLEQGFLLNGDLGSRTYLGEFLGEGARPEAVDKLYHDALDALVVIQSRSAANAAQLPPYDAALLQREMALFPEWFCSRHLGLSLDAQASADLQRVFDALTEEALKQPRVFVHRDYHSRNLMLTDGGKHGPNPGILDFQDAVNGPVTYDLVSVLRDCYIEWPLARIHGWVARFRERAQAAGVGVGKDEKEFLRWFDWMGVQRHLKVLGIFSRLWYRDGKSGYLKDIPRTLEYVRAVVRNYPELATLSRLIETKIVAELPKANAAALQS
jgi:aminoglycoside/choline kinase family phosphotransferase